MNLAMASTTKAIVDVKISENNLSEDTESVKEGTAVELTKEGKNLKHIRCQRCPSTILVSGTATLVTHEFALPDSSTKEAVNQESNISNQYWCVDNMYSFENVGFSKTVDGVKYLICADCEVGPIGFHDLNTKLSYVSITKINYC